MCIRDSHIFPPISKISDKGLFPIIPFPPTTTISLLSIAAEVPLFATGRGVDSTHIEKTLDGKKIILQQINKNK